MLSSESLRIQEEIRRALADRHGETSLADHFRAFDTICSATQDRQDAVLALLEEKPDLMVIIGGYNSSNTNHLAAIACRSVPAYHIEDAACIEASGALRHKPYGRTAEIRTDGWLPAGPVLIGLTAGASTPNNKIGEVIAAIAALRRADLEPQSAL
jgi:4-hydroxy-3-methylbut-2-enyl diphosphate reductase